MITSLVSPKVNEKPCEITVAGRNCVRGSIHALPSRSRSVPAPPIGVLISRKHWSTLFTSSGDTGILRPGAMINLSQDSNQFRQLRQSFSSYRQSSADDEYSCWILLLDFYVLLTRSRLLTGQHFPARRTSLWVGLMCCGLRYCSARAYGRNKGYGTPNKMLGYERCLKLLIIHMLNLNIWCESTAR